MPAGSTSGETVPNGQQGGMKTSPSHAAATKLDVSPLPQKEEEEEEGEEGVITEAVEQGETIFGACVRVSAGLCAWNMGGSFVCGVSSSSSRTPCCPVV